VRTRKQYPSLEWIQRRTPVPSDRPVWAQCFPARVPQGNSNTASRYVPTGREALRAFSRRVGVFVI
jgi:hypothetical protein